MVFAYKKTNNKINYKNSGFVFVSIAFKPVKILCPNLCFPICFRNSFAVDGNY
jgi:hypothetical protein